MTWSDVAEVEELSRSDNAYVSACEGLVVGFTSISGLNTVPDKYTAILTALHPACLTLRLRLKMCFKQPER